MSVPKVKSKVKVKKAQSESDSDGGSEHELFHYANDRVQLMKEVLKLLKPNKIKAIAPDFMKNLDIEEINSMLLEELLGISNKRLKNILNGVNIDESSSESDDEKQPVDVISLDDISDVEDFNSEEPQKKNKKNKKDKEVGVKKEKPDEKETLMSVLEILELQARARAIRSQLALENEQKNAAAEKKAVETDDSDVEVVLQKPRNEEIVIIDSENENIQEEMTEKNETTKNKENKEGNEKQNANTQNDKNIADTKSLGEDISEKERIKETTKSIRESDKCGDGILSSTDLSEEKTVEKSKESKLDNQMHVKEKVTESGAKVNPESNYSDDTIVINLDTIEIEEMEK